MAPERQKRKTLQSQVGTEPCKTIPAFSTASSGLPGQRQCCRYLRNMLVTPLQLKLGLTTRDVTLLIVVLSTPGADPLLLSLHAHHGWPVSGAEGDEPGFGIGCTMGNLNNSFNVLSFHRTPLQYSWV